MKTTKLTEKKTYFLMNEEGEFVQVTKKTFDHKRSFEPGTGWINNRIIVKEFSDGSTLYTLEVYNVAYGDMIDALTKVGRR